MVALRKLQQGNGKGFGKLNSALISLIAKRADAIDVGDFRPISLIHSFAKLFSKLLANRLWPHMDDLISANQSAFIRGRCLHDNFMLVRQLARKFHAMKVNGVLLKLDISRAFDSIFWSFLLEVLQHMSFSKLWLNYIAILLRTASTRIVVNGVPGNKILYARGLRQGDPILPILFVMGMEVFTALMIKATEDNLLTRLRGFSALQRTSIYTDDVVLFIKPMLPDLTAIKSVLQIFGVASGLHINYRKSSATLIRGDARDEELVSETLQFPISNFPIRYLGLQLALRPLTKAEWQPVLDKLLDCVPAWQWGLIVREGSLILIKAVVFARPIHLLLITDAPF
jgi:hypothetical protein